MIVLFFFLCLTINEKFENIIVGKFILPNKILTRGMLVVFPRSYLFMTATLESCLGYHCKRRYALQACSTTRETET